ncbi:MAG: hypothetical protein ACK5MH_08300 [Bacteroidales bacterium]
MKELLIITGVVLISFVLIFFLTKELIKTFKNKPYNPKDREKL